MSEDALVQFAWSTGSAASVREREVVEDEHLTGVQAHLGPDSIEVQASLREELELVGQLPELHPAQKPGVRLDARKNRRLTKSGLDDPSEAALDVPGCVI